MSSSTFASARPRRSEASGPRHRLRESVDRVRKRSRIPRSSRMGIESHRRHRAGKARCFAQFAKPSVLLQPPTTVSQTGNPPVDWDTTTRRNIVWSVGWETKCMAVPSSPATWSMWVPDNTRHISPAFEEDSGVLRAFRATNGEFLWQDVAPRVERGLRDWLLPSTTSAPYVEGDRVLRHRRLSTSFPRHAGFRRW